MENTRKERTQHMSTNGSGPSGSPGQNVGIPDTIDFVYDASTSGSLGSNSRVRSTSDWDEVVGEAQTGTNEVLEVYKVEYIPPRNGDGSIQEIESIRLWDGDNLYPKLRYRAPYTGYFGPDQKFSTPPLGNPVLSGENDPERDPIGTATPKFGPNTTVTPQVANNGSQVSNAGDDDASFRVRLHVWRWQGDESEMADFFRDNYGRTTFQQSITMANTFTGVSRSYTRGEPIRITPSASTDSHGQFTKLTGGINQDTPKVYPWATWATNNNATSANTYYNFSEQNSRVDEAWKELEFDFTDQKEAVRFDYVTVNEPDNLLNGKFVIDERDEDPEVQLTPNPAHQLPEQRPLDGSVPPLDDDQLPVNITQLLGSPQVIWDDGGGFRVVDNGNSIPADNIRVGVIGKRLELTS